MTPASDHFYSGKRVLIAGGGGFIGGWLVSELSKLGPKLLRVVDVKPQSEWFQFNDDAENLELDLRDDIACKRAVADVDIVFNLAADMGGMGFIENNKALCMLSVLINTNLLNYSRKFNIERYFFASSACVYNQSKQTNPDNLGLKEVDAYPADPEDGYGWEKLFGERMCRHFFEDFKLMTRVARFHNVYGPYGTYDGGREKAPAAICRKIALAKLTGKHEISIWGDGRQTRSFMFISDCLEGINRIIQSDYSQPLNLGSNRSVTINELVDIVENIAEIKVERKYEIDAPKGVRGRNSDNSLIQEILGWQPRVSLEEGLSETYRWIYQNLASRIN